MITRQKIYYRARVLRRSRYLVKTRQRTVYVEPNHRPAGKEKRALNVLINSGWNIQNTIENDSSKR